MSTIDARIMHQGNSVAPKSTQLALSVDLIIHNAAELMSESAEFTRSDHSRQGFTIQQRNLATIQSTAPHRS